MFQFVINFISKKNILVLIATAIICILLAPILVSNLYSDDLMNYQLLKSIPDFNFEKMLQCSKDQIAVTLQGGRYSPIAFYLLNFMFWLPNSIAQYKALIYCSNLFALFSFIFFLKKSGMNHLAGFAILFYALLIQFQIAYHDPFTSLHAMYPLAMALTFFAIGLFLDFIKQGSIIKLLISFVLTCTTLLITEIGVVTFLIIYCLAIFNFKKIKPKSWIVIPYLIMPIIYFGWLKTVRDNLNGMYPGVQSSFDFNGMLNVLQCQLFGMLPMTNFYHVRAIPQILFMQFSQVFVAISVLLLVGLLFLFQRYAKHQKIVFQKFNFNIGMIGFLLMLIPPMILMFSAKYQNELELGRAYLPIYFQDFGFAILLAILFERIIQLSFFKNIFFRNTIYVLVSLMIVSSFLLNYHSVKEKNRALSMPANNFYLALKSGLLNPAQSGAIMILGKDFFYQQPEKYKQIFYNLSGKNFDVVEKEDFDLSNVTTQKIVYKVDYDFGNNKSQLFEWNNESKKIKKMVEE